MFDMSNKSDPNHENMVKLQKLQRELMSLWAEMKEAGIDHFINNKEHKRISKLRTDWANIINDKTPWHQSTYINIDTSEIEDYITRMKEEIKRTKKLEDGVWTEKTLPNKMKQVMFTFEDEQELN